MRRFLKEDSRLCDLICNDGSRHRVRCCIRGHLLELNERLLTDPDILNKKASSDGYIAIVQVRREEEETICSKSPHLITAEDYLKQQNQRSAANDMAKS